MNDDQARAAEIAGEIGQRILNRQRPNLDRVIAHVMDGYVDDTLDWDSVADTAAEGIAAWRQAHPGETFDLDNTEHFDALTEWVDAVVIAL